MDQLSDKSFPCSYPDCRRNYATKTNLRRHLRINHLAMHNYTCTVCSKALHSKQSMREHMNRHTGDKPFFCPQYNCGMQFKFSSQLSNHRKAHALSQTGTEHVFEWLPETTETTLQRQLQELPTISQTRQLTTLLPLHPDLKVV